MTADTLLTYAQSRKHEVIYTNTSIAFSVEESRQCYIAIPRGLSSVDEKEALAHELGHCEYGGFYNRHSKYDIRAKAERRADKWAFARLVPYGRLMQAVRHGVQPRVHLHHQLLVLLIKDIGQGPHQLIFSLEVMIKGPLGSL